MPIHDWTRVGAGTFHDFHATWIVEIKRVLNRGILPPGYYAMAEQIAGSLGLDVLTLQATDPEDEPSPHEANGGGALTVAVAPPKVYLTDTTEEDQYALKRKTLVIRHSSEDRVVALVEIMSPGNKGSRHAIRSFIDKVAGALRKGIHVLVVDVLPPTPRDPQGIHPLIWGEFVDRAFTLPPGKARTLASYVGGPVKRVYLQPVAVGDPLPEMPLFLEPETYVNVPLEPTYRAAFDDVPSRWREVLERA